MNVGVLTRDHEMPVLKKHNLYICDTRWVDGVSVTALDVRDSDLNYEIVLSFVETYKLDYLWILSDVYGTDVDPVFEGYTLFTSRKKDFGSRRGALRGWRMYRKGAKGNDGRDIKIILCQNAQMWEFHKLTDGLELLRSIVLLMKQGIRFELSPGGTGRGIIKGRVRPEYLEKADLSMLPLEAGKDLAIRASFKRELTAEEKKRKYLIVYDKSAQYLRGCTGVELGVGTPRFVDFSQAHNIVFHERQAGLWLVSVDGESPQWMWTPYVHYLHRTKRKVVFYSAYIWDRHHEILRPWAEYLWRVRVAVAHNKIAKRTNKTFYTQALGLMRQREEWGRDKHDELFRPDWDGLVKQHAYCLILYKIDQLRARGYDACWCNVDEIGFLSDEEDPFLAVPGLATDSSLGGYTPKYKAIPLENVLSAFEPGVSHAEAMHIIGHAGRVVGAWE